MALVSYSGEGVISESEFSRLLPLASTNLACVDDWASMRPTMAAGGVNVGPGWIGKAGGLVWENSGQFVAVDSSGAPSYQTLYVELDYAPTAQDTSGRGSVATYKLSTKTAVPAAPAESPGKTMMPIALVQTDNGVIKQVYDCRLWHNGSHVFVNDNALAVHSPKPGASMTSNYGVTWTRCMSDVGAPYWLPTASGALWVSRSDVLGQIPGPGARSMFAATTQFTPPKDGARVRITANFNVQSRQNGGFFAIWLEEWFTPWGGGTAQVRDIQRRAFITDAAKGHTVHNVCLNEFRVLPDRSTYHWRVAGFHSNDGNAWIDTDYGGNALFAEHVGFNF